MRSAFLSLCLIVSGEWCVADDSRPRPLMRDFIGLDAHAERFKPQLYAPVARILRSDHPVKGDLGDDTSSLPTLPMSRNGVDWRQIYGSWRLAGYHTHATLQIDGIAPGAWKDMDRDARAYGRAFARAFGPSGKEPILEAVEIGGEPGNYDDATHRRLFESMARGVREGDPAMRIATCATNLGPNRRCSRSVNYLAGLDALWDILSIRCCVETGPHSVRRGGFPEDPATELAGEIRQLLAWRDAHAEGKQVWVTGFGCDEGTKSGARAGDPAVWPGGTEEQQAMWTVRAFLLLAGLGVDRVHLSLFDERDEPHVDGGGVTRTFLPRPAFHAMAWLQRSLGEYRFSRAEREDLSECYTYEFVHGTDPRRRVWVVWRTSGEPRTVRLFNDLLRVIRAERMPLLVGRAEAAPVTQEIEGYIAIEATVHPMMIWLEKP